MKIQLLWLVVVHSPWPQTHTHVCTHNSADLYTVKRLPTHTRYNGHSSLIQWNVNALSPQIKEHIHRHIKPHSQHTIYNKVIWEPWRSNIQICQREKNDNSIESQSWGILWLWLFIWSRYSQLQNECKYRSLLDIKTPAGLKSFLAVSLRSTHLLAPFHLLSLFFLHHEHFSFISSLLLPHFLLRWVS